MKRFQTRARISHRDPLSCVSVDGPFSEGCSSGVTGERPARSPRGRHCIAGKWASGGRKWVKPARGAVTQTFCGAKEASPDSAGPRFPAVVRGARACPTRQERDGQDRTGWLSPASPCGVARPARVAARTLRAASGRVARERLHHGGPVGTRCGSTYMCCGSNVLGSGPRWDLPGG